MTPKRLVIYDTTPPCLANTVAQENALLQAAADSGLTGVHLHVMPHPHGTLVQVRGYATPEWHHPHDDPRTEAA